MIRINNDVMYIKISGVLKLADQRSLQTAGIKLIEQGKKLKLFVTVQDFQGWEKGVDWGDVDFFVTHSNDIVKIAVVGDERWKEEVFAFLGKGLRSTEIEFFGPSSMDKAQDWIVQ
jgi:hypothetical protein